MRLSVFLGGGLKASAQPLCVHAGVCSVWANPGSCWTSLSFPRVSPVQSYSLCLKWLLQGQTLPVFHQLFLLFWGRQWERMPLFFSFFEYYRINPCFTLPLLSFKSSSLSALFWYILGYGDFFFSLFGFCGVGFFESVCVFFACFYYFCHLIFWYFYFYFPSSFLCPLFFLPILFPALCAWLPFHIFFLYLCSKKAT